MVPAKHTSHLALSLILGTAALTFLPGVTQPVAADVQVQAQWVPSFNPSQRIYINPALKNSPLMPNLEGLEESFKSESDLDVYLIATTGAGTGNQAIARVTADQIAATWQANQAFNGKRSLIIYWIIRTDMAGKGSVAANSGTELRDAGVTPDWLSDPENGGVGPALRANMPGNPKGAFVAIVEGVDGKLWWHGFWSMLPGVVMLLSGSAIGIGSLIVFLKRRHKRWLEVSEIVSGWSTPMETANANYVRLTDAYLGFFQQQQDWEQRFSGRTLSAYQTAAREFATLSVYLDAANDREREAKAALKAGRFDLAEALLKTEPVRVTGAQIQSTQVRSLFESLVSEETVEPPVLLTRMDALYRSVDRNMGAIVAAFTRVQETSATLKSTAQELIGLQESLTKVGLQITPYRNRFHAVSTQVESQKTQWEADPMGSGADTAYSELEQIKGDIGKAVKLATQVSTLRQELAGTEQRLAQLRQRPVDYKYPLSPGEQAPEGIATTCLTFVEPGTNLDNQIVSVHQISDRAWELLQSGKVAEATERWDEAQKQLTGINQCCDQTLTKKDEIRQLVILLRSLVQSLEENLPAARDAGNSLAAEFLEASVETELTGLESANRMLERLYQQQQAIKDRYDCQHYLQAHAFACQGIDGAKAALTQTAAVVSRLEALRSFRAETRQLVETFRPRLPQLQHLQTTHSFTTSGEIDQKIEGLARDYQRVEAAANQEKADWDKLLPQVKALHAVIDPLTQEIQACKQSYESAKAGVAQLQTAISSEQNDISHSDVTSSPKNTLKLAQKLLVRLQASLETAKSDWAEMLSSATRMKTDVETAGNTARSDKQFAANARSAIQAAETEIDSADRDYGEDVTADLEKARAVLGTARSHYQDQNYVSAISQAQQAKSSAESAESAAKREASERYKERTKPVVSTTYVSISSSSSLTSQDDDDTTGVDYTDTSGGDDYESTSGGCDY